MRLIDQEPVGAPVLREVPAQIPLRIKNIIVIADHGVRPHGHIERKFEGTYLMLFAHGCERRPANLLLFQRIAHRRLDAIIVTQRERASELVTGHAAAHANFFPGGERHRSPFQSRAAQIRQRFLGNRAPDRPGRQIKNAFEFPRAHGLHRREKNGHGLPDPGGRSQKQSPAIRQHTISRHRQFALPRSIIGKGKSQPLHGRIPDLDPAMLFAQPGHVNRGGLREELRQFSKGNALAKLGYFAGGQFQINQLQDEFRQVIFPGVHEGIEPGLRPVQGIGLTIPAGRHGFDFLQQHLTRGDQQSIDPPPDEQGKLLRFHRVLHRQFGQIPRRTRALNLLMPANAGQRPVGSYKFPFPAEITPAQDKLHQVTHCNRAPRLLDQVGHG